MRIFVLLATLGGLLVVAAAVSVSVWISLGDVEISFHGLIALALGTVVSLGVGGGLMWLVFYSSRHGYDDIDR